MDRHQAIWDTRYEKLMRGGALMPGEPWLETWLPLVPSGDSRRAFDVGCGAGYNARLLQDNGFDVSAVDVSDRAIALCRRMAPKARIQWADLREGLPFVGEHFQLIVADLSLHYFTWIKTADIVGQLADRLTSGGIFAGRFNSIGDTNYGAGNGTPVCDESNLLMVNGIEKRFFTRDCFARLFIAPWRILFLEEKITNRFGARKVLWEIVATRCSEHSVEDDTEREA